MRAAIYFGLYFIAAAINFEAIPTSPTIVGLFGALLITLDVEEVFLKKRP